MEISKEQQRGEKKEKGKNLFLSLIRLYKLGFVLLRVSPSYSGLYKLGSNAQPFGVRCSNFVLYMQSAFSLPSSSS